MSDDDSGEAESSSGNSDPEALLGSQITTNGKDPDGGEDAGHETSESDDG